MGKCSLLNRLRTTFLFPRNLILPQRGSSHIHIQTIVLNINENKRIVVIGPHIINKGHTHSMQYMYTASTKLRNSKEKELKKDP